MWEKYLSIFNGAPLKFGNEYVIASYILLYMWLLIHAGIKVDPCW